MKNLPTLATIVVFTAFSLFSCTESPNALKTGSPVDIKALGINNVNEISFKSARQNAKNGYFDRVTVSGKTTDQVTKATPVTLSGWAVIPQENRLADMVLVTEGENNFIVAVAAVNLARPDVARKKSSAYKYSGWSATINPSVLPSNKVELRAWAYNSQQKEANQLNRTHELVLIE